MKVVVSSKNSIVRDSLDVRIELDSLSLKLSLDRFFHSLAFKSFSSKKPSRQCEAWHKTTKEKWSG